MTRVLRLASTLLLAAPLWGQGSQPANQPSAPDDSQSLAVEVVKAVPAVYPVAALAGKIQGAVPVSVVISPAGDVTGTEVQEGDPLLQAAAVAAAERWKFKVRKADEYVSLKCWASLVFDFQLPSENAPTPEVAGKFVHGEEFPNVIRVSEIVSKLMIVKNAFPFFSRYTQGKAVNGTLVLDVIVGRNGRVREANALSGPELLKAPMTAAMKQWEFKPYVFIGEEVEMRTQVTVKVNVRPDGL